MKKQQFSIGRATHHFEFSRHKPIVNTEAELSLLKTCHFGQQFINFLQN